jgi:hypothetical protein
MINLCPHCKNIPVENGMISCQTTECLNFNESYFVWEWQALNKELIDLGEVVEKSILS